MKRTGRPLLISLALALVSLPASANGIDPVPDQAAAAVSQFGTARTLPDRLALRYAVQAGDGGFTLGQSRYSWQVSEGRYSLTSVTEATGITALLLSKKIVQTSAGRITAAGLQPEQFQISKGKRGPPPARFDWPRKRLLLPSGEVALPATTQDLLSFPFHLAMTVRDDQMPWQLPVTNGKKLKDYDFRFVGREPLRILGRTSDTLHLRGSRPEEGSLDVWLAPDRHWLPVRIRTVDQNDQAMELNLISQQD